MRPTVGLEELEAVKKVFESRILTEGEVTRQFEKKVAEYVGVKYAVAVTSCTTALELALQVANIKRGAEVLIPDFTHLATGDAVLNVGLEPVLVDVSASTFNMDFKSAKSMLSRKTRCVLPVSLFGCPIDKKALEDFTHSRDLVVIEDAACSLGGEVDGMKVGSLADITCFSFHPRKLLTTGEGGMLVTNNEEYAEAAQSMKNFGLGMHKDKLRGLRRGSNYKMANVLSAIGLVQLGRFEQILHERRKRVRIYTELLANNPSVEIQTIPGNMKSTYQSYCILMKRHGIRDRVRQCLIEEGIEAQLGTNSLHLEPIFRETKRARLLNSPRVYKNALTLPLHNELTREDQERVCFALDAAIKSA